MALPILRTMARAIDYDRLYKVVVVGGHGVGKSSLLQWQKVRARPLGQPHSGWRRISYVSVACGLSGQEGVLRRDFGPELGVEYVRIVCFMVITNCVAQLVCRSSTGTGTKMPINFFLG